LTLDTNNIDTIELLGNDILVAGYSDVGRVRKLNEDSLLIDKDLGLVIIADGMGGHEAGDLASMTATQAIREYLSDITSDLSDDTLTLHNQFAISDDDTLREIPSLELGITREAVIYANQKVYNLNKKRGFEDGVGMGTTLVGFWVKKKGQIIRFHIGDSRAYRLRNDDLHILTRDHSQHQLWLDSGKLGTEPKKNILLRALGPWQKIEPEVASVDTRSKDRYLLCSDGLTSMVVDEVIHTHCINNKDTPINQLCAELINQANANGGKDNITVILVESR